MLCRVIGFLRLLKPHSAQGPPSIRASSSVSKDSRAVSMVVAASYKPNEHTNRQAVSRW
jgi:hypothetical protein